jgi:hypothetical protein
MLTVLVYTNFDTRTSTDSSSNVESSLFYLQQTLMDHDGTALTVGRRDICRL